MTSVKGGTQAFLKTTHKLSVQAQRDGANITKAAVTQALGTLTADGKVSKADVKAAKTFLENAPLTAGAKDALKNFVGDGPRTTNGANSPLNLRLRGGGESTVARGGGESTVRRGGGESTVRRGGDVNVRRGGDVTVRRGGGESTVLRGGGEATGRRGGGE